MDMPHACPGIQQGRYASTLFGPDEQRGICIPSCSSETCPTDKGYASQGHVSTQQDRYASTLFGSSPSSAASSSSSYSSSSSTLQCRLLTPMQALLLLTPMQALYIRCIYAYTGGQGRRRRRIRRRTRRRMRQRRTRRRMRQRRRRGSGQEGGITTGERFMTDRKSQQRPLGSPKRGDRGRVGMQESGRGRWKRRPPSPPPLTKIRIGIRMYSGMEGTLLVAVI